MVGFLFGFHGRIRRSQWWLAQLGTSAAAALGFLALAYMFGGHAADSVAKAVSGSVGLGGYIVLVWVQLAVSVKRLHDMGRSGWLYLIALVPFLGSLILLGMLGFRDSERGDNRFGMSQKYPHADRTVATFDRPNLAVASIDRDRGERRLDHPLAHGARRLSQLGWPYWGDRCCRLVLDRRRGGPVAGEEEGIQPPPPDRSPGTPARAHGPGWRWRPGSRSPGSRRSARPPRRWATVRHRAGGDAGGCGRRKTANAQPLGAGRSARGSRSPAGRSGTAPAPASPGWSGRLGQA